MQVFDETNNINLTEIPESLLNHKTSLRALRVDFCLIEEIEPWIGDFEVLEELVLDNNILVGLPETIGKLRNLKMLSLASNNITRLPESIGHLGDLLEIDISDNKLARLPESFKNLTNLYDFRFKNVPFRSLHGVKGKHLKNNSLVNIANLPSEIQAYARNCAWSKDADACDAVDYFYKDSIEDIVDNFVKSGGKVTQRERIRLCHELILTPKGQRYIMESTSVSDIALQNLQKCSGVDLNA